MQICCCSICFRDCNLDDMLSRVAEAGYEVLELIAIPGWMHLDLREMAAKELGEKLEANGLRLGAIYPGGIKCSSEQAYAESISYIKKAVDYAEELCCKRIVFTGAGRDQALLSAAIKGYQELAQYLSGRDVVVCLENHYRNQIEFPKDYEEIFLNVESDNFGITLDTGHFTSSKVPLVGLVDAFGEKIKHIHVKDHIGTLSVALGKGETDNAGLIRRLHRIGFDGLLSVELEVQDAENLHRYAREALRYLQGLVAAAGTRPGA